MAKLSTTSVFGDLLVDGMIHGNVTGNLTGNASTATSATTATSAGKWTTARTITIGSKGKTVDGSGNVSWTLAEIGAAASDHKHGLLHDNLTCTLENTATDNGWSMINSSYNNGFLLKSIRTNSTAPNWICNNYSAGIAFGGADTKGVISTAYSSPSIKFAGGNGTKPVWWIGLTGTTGTSYNLANFENKNHGTHVTYSTSAPLVAGTASAGSAANVARGDHVHPAQTSVSGNAGTATKLQTPRTINGTNFDGSANITTANWGTARTLTIGNKGQSVNGSGNITWSTGDILGNATSLGKDSDWNTANTTGIYEASGFNEEGATGANRPVGAYSWGGVLTLRHKNVTNQIYLSHGSNQMWIRGGWNGSFNTSWARVYTTDHKPTYSDVGAAAASHGTHVTWSTTTPKANGTAAVGSETKVARGDHVHPLQTTVSGNAGTATKLQTARTITIGNKSNTFDGSANIAYTLADIGAAATSHTHTQINSRGKVTCESGVAGRPAANGLSMSEAYNNGYPTTYGNVISLKGMGDGQILVGWSGTDGAHAPVYVRSKRDNTSTANWSQWAQFYTTANKPTYSDVGAAAASHGTHVDYATATPKAHGTAAVGTSAKVAREDHVHPLQTSVSGNAGTATKLQIAREIKIGNKSNTFDGSANITYTLADIGAATSGHTHNYAGSSSAGGAANSAVKLSSARTINGTSFDGSANITTANWGTARKINQISVNGSQDYKIPLDYYTCAIGNKNDYPYHHIMTTGQCAGSWTDKSITIYIINHYNSSGMGIAKCTLRTNDAANGATASGEIKWLVRSGFNEDALCFNIRNTAKDAYMDVFYKAPGTYAGLTWYVLSEGARGSHSSQWTKQNTKVTDNNGEKNNVYNETEMKALRTYTSTLQSATDHGAVNSAKTAAACSGNAATATKLATARNIKIGNATKSFNGTANVEFTLAEIGIGSSISAVASNLSGVTINGYDSMMTTINSNLGNL